MPYFLSKNVKLKLRCSTDAALQRESAKFDKTSPNPTRMLKVFNADQNPTSSLKGVVLLLDDMCVILFIERSNL